MDSDGLTRQEDSPVHRFRIRWQFEPGRSIKDLEGPATIDLPAVGLCEIKPVSPATPEEGQGLALIGPEFESKEQAAQKSEVALSGL